MAGPTLKYNPGRIDPANEAWTASRKPLVAEWEVVGKKGKSDGKFFTVNVHLGSKGGSSSIQGDARPPANGGVKDRLAQATLTANFVKVRFCSPLFVILAVAFLDQAQVLLRNELDEAQPRPHRTIEYRSQIESVAWLPGPHTERQRTAASATLVGDPEGHRRERGFNPGSSGVFLRGPDRWCLAAKLHGSAYPLCASDIETPSSLDMQI